MLASVVLCYLFRRSTSLAYIQSLAMWIPTTFLPILFVYAPNYMTTLISFISSQFIFLGWCCIILAMNDVSFALSFQLFSNSNTTSKFTSSEFVCDSYSLIYSLLLIINNKWLYKHAILLLFSFIESLTLVWHRFLLIKFNEIFIILGQSEIMSQWMFVVEWKDRKLHQFIYIFTFWYYSFRTNESVRSSS